MNRIVVKVGSSTLTRNNGELDLTYIDALADQVAGQLTLGRSVILVSSGAIPVGRDRLHLTAKPHTIPQKQAAAAVGQGLLMQAYAAAFDRHGLAVGQVLLTRDDLADRSRYVNASNTLHALIGFGAVPIVNENDTIAVEEIRFGDNDTLAARVASLANADLLILLSDVAGLYDRNPAQFPDAKLIPNVTKIDKAIERLAGGAGSLVGTGGMRTKIDAAKICVQAGFPMVIADGSAVDVIRLAVDGEIGTRFTPTGDTPLPSRKRWLAFGGATKGAITVNDGARKQIVGSGKSLLAAGVTEVTGDFVEGDLVYIADLAGDVFAQGVVNFDSRTLTQVKGMQSAAIGEALGGKIAASVIHRDNLVLVTP